MMCSCRRISIASGESELYHIAQMIYPTICTNQRPVAEQVILHWDMVEPCVKSSFFGWEFSLLYMKNGTRFIDAQNYWTKSFPFTYGDIKLGATHFVDCWWKFIKNPMDNIRNYYPNICIYWTFYFVTTHRLATLPLRILRNIPDTLISWNKEMLKIDVWNFTCIFDIAHGCICKQFEIPKPQMIYINIYEP